MYYYVIHLTTCTTVLADGESFRFEVVCHESLLWRDCSDEVPTRAPLPAHYCSHIFSNLLNLLLKI